MATARWSAFDWYRSPIERPIYRLFVKYGLAYRVSTARQADHVFVLDEGRIAERGTLEELLDVVSCT